MQEALPGIWPISQNQKALHLARFAYLLALHPVFIADLVLSTWLTMQTANHAGCQRLTLATWQRI